MSKSALGRGLGALLGGAGSPASPAAAKPAGAAMPASVNIIDASLRDPIRKVALSRIKPGALQPRKEFSPDALRELAESIRQQGVLQPLVVRPSGSDFELIAGERRWRAAQLAGLTELPVVVREADDATVLEMMLIENLQRENLNPVEEAQGYQQLITQFQLTQEQAAEKVGKNRVTVANALRLLKLPAEVQDYIRRGQLSAGHAKVILGLAGADEQKLAAGDCLRGGWSVRALEEWVSQWQARASREIRKPGQPAASVPDAHMADLQSRLQQRLGGKVQLRYRKGKGAVTIHFYSDDDLERIMDILSVKLD